MSKLSDDLKDEEILIQLAETNESIFQIIIKTGADDDMNAILAQEPILTNCGKRGCVFPTVIWPAFRTGQYRVNDHPYHAPQFTF